MSLMLSEVVKPSSDFKLAYFLLDDRLIDLAMEQSQTLMSAQIHFVVSILLWHRLRRP